MLSCSQKRQLPKSNSLHPVLEKKDTVVINTKFSNILNGLSNSYILNFNSYNKKDFLKFYDKSLKDYKKDSINYYSAKDAFFKCDSSIISFLQTFKNDTSQCTWIFEINPYSSGLQPWEFAFNKEQGALVLIHDYLKCYDGNIKTITTSSSDIKRIIEDVSLDKIDSLKSSKRWLSL